jgi:hypothetical protein
VKWFSLIVFLLVASIAQAREPITYPSAQKWHELSQRRAKYKTLDLQMTEINKISRIRTKIYYVGDLVIPIRGRR